MHDLGFAELFEKVRQGDGEAAEALVRRFEPAIRRVVQLRLQHSPLRRHFDSADVCQSVLGSFFVRAALGQYDVDGPEQLVRLLAAMARNKVIDLGRKRHGVPADPVPGRADGRGFDEVAGGDPTPSRVVVGRDLLEQVRARLSDDERRLAELRAAGCEWAEIAVEIGGSAEGARKRLARALDRVARAVGLEG
jgi:RNA polymerase sigma-70 factor (ECF subfamily)